MAEDRFVKALKNQERPIIRIPPNYFNSTRHDVTYFSNSSVYSKESEIKTVIANRDRAFKSRRQ